VTVDAAGGLHVLLPDGGSVLDSVASPSTGFGTVQWANRDETVVSAFGQFGFLTSLKPWVAAAIAVDDSAPKAAGVGQTATLPIAGGGTLALTAVDDETLRIDLSPPGPFGADQTGMAFACTPADHFLGFGEQTNALDQLGLAFTLTPMEDGIGKLAGSTHTQSGYDLTGNTNDSYYPMASFLDPRGFGMVVNDTRFVEYDLCSTRSDAFSVGLWNGTLELELVFGSTPLELVTRLTALTGRQPLGVPWTFGVWVDAVEGAARVQTVAAELRDNQIPSSAIWTEDWDGEGCGASFNCFDWTPDETLYPGFSGLAASLHTEGFKWLGYFNTFVLQNTPEWDQSVNAGTLVQAPDGGNYVITTSAAVPGGLVDLTNPAATAWMGAAMQQVVADGMDGWMADFGEWLPFDAVMADGTTGASSHDRFPLLWAQLNQQVLSQAIPSGDFVFFTRSGWNGQAANIRAMWAGDQNTNWGQDDGLPSVIPMGFNLGIQGIAAWGSDIGGYTPNTPSLADPAWPPTSKELFLRWTELGAYSPIMRTHHGYVQDQDWRFDSDAQTLQIFGQYAREHFALFPYLYTLATATAQTGVGIMLPIWFNYPDDPGALTRIDEFMLGSSLLVAPVLTEGATTRTVHLPAGRWLGWETPDSYEGPTDVTVPADIATCPVYATAGTVLPLLTPDIQTLASVTDPAVVTLAAAQTELIARAYLGANGTFTSYDGTVLSLTSTPGVTLTTLSAGGGTLPSCSTGTLPCGDIDTAARLATVQVTGADVVVTGDRGTQLEVKSPQSRIITAQLRY
jgi:alpha-glucosidase (family GH31 glycosyl hydrolase)